MRMCLTDGSNKVTSWSHLERTDGKDLTHNLDVFADSSWGDCHSSRRSTSSSTIFLNGAYVLSFSRTQATIALSSCEAELYAANAAIAEGLFLGRLCEFLVAEVKDGPTDHVNIRLFSDSSAANWNDPTERSWPNETY
jgi:hypothetical protein